MDEFPKLQHGNMASIMAVVYVYWYDNHRYVILLDSYVPNCELV